VTKAEPGYSDGRKRALEDEWRSCHPLIRTYVNSVMGLPVSTSVDELTIDRLLALVMEVEELDRKLVDEVERIAKHAYDRDKEFRFKRLAKAMVSCLYKVGAVGIKTRTSKVFEYSYEHRGLIDVGEIEDDTRFVIHPMLVSALGSRPNAETNAA
jgi:hypothetical protein